jgi:hypothetical protein
MPSRLDASCLWHGLVWWGRRVSTVCTACRIASGTVVSLSYASFFQKATGLLLPQACPRLSTYRTLYTPTVNLPRMNSKCTCRP